MKFRGLLSLFALVPILCLPACRGFQHRRDTLVGLDTAGWTQLGKRSVRLGGDRDVIGVTFLQGAFRRIMIVVHGSALEMHDVVVTFANGETFSPATRLHFAEDSRSRVIDLPGIKRVVKKVEFRYRSKNLLTGRAEVELWGRH